METATALRSSFSSLSHTTSKLPAQIGSFRPGTSRVGSRPMVSGVWVQHNASTFRMKLANRKVGFEKRKQIVMRASMQHSDSGCLVDSIAPLQLESPTGQFLSQILVSHPHLVSAAVEQQLEQLQTDRDAEEEKEESSASGTELVLYRRIAELKANERKKALEEILYALVVQKFMDADVALVPAITPSSPDNAGRVDTWPCQEQELEGLHSPEANEMIQKHLSLILGKRIGDSNSVAQISKLRVGQVYAASVMYGYFLKRIDQRLQLEKTMRIVPNDFVNEEKDIEQVTAEARRPSGKSSDESLVNVVKPSRLRNYVMSFDGETLHRYATIRSKEAINIIEKHTEALFGRPEIVITPQGTIDSSKDELIKISFGGLRRLVLEAVTFGSFLWDVESYVDSRYHFVTN